MGSSSSANLNPDKEIQLMITFNKPFYYTGELVQGIVHINCLAQRPYIAINMYLDCEEQVFWTEHHDKHTEVYNQKRKTYHDEATLTSLNMGVMPGHYSYPFAFPLSGGMPATYIMDDRNYIKWTITAQLPPAQKFNQQAFQKTLYVREPPRAIMGNLMGQTMSESLCCNCCCSCGSTQFNLQSNVSYLSCGQALSIQGSLDTSMSKTKIDNYKVVLRQKITRIAGKTRVDQNDVDLFDARKSLNIGEQDNFSLQVSIPPAKGYTALGCIFSRAYYLTLEAEVCCCYSNPRLQIHGILLDTSVPANNQPNVPPPPGWNPLVADPIMIANFHPYIYKPDPGMTAHNQGTGQLVNIQQDMSHQMAPPQQYPGNYSDTNLYKQ